MSSLTMVRVPAELARRLSTLANWHARRMGMVGQCELTPTFLHHIALRRGVEAMEADIKRESLTSRAMPVNEVPSVEEIIADRWEGVDGE